MEDAQIRDAVRERYASFANADSSCCGNQTVKKSSCGCASPSAAHISKAIGYVDEQIADVPDGANLGLGCGNPTALADLAVGETVLDLGSGAGFDCFLAAKQVGPQGRVIGVDMTPEMLAKARANAASGGYDNVEFRMGEIENLPVADGSIDAIISNCVINLSPDKPRVFSEAFRALRPGGRLMVSDIVLTGELPDVIASSLAAYAGCIAGASRREDYLSMLSTAGFAEVEVVSEQVFDIDDDLIASALREFGAETITVADVQEAASSVLSISVRAVKASD